MKNVKIIVSIDTDINDAIAEGQEPSKDKKFVKFLAKEIDEAHNVQLSGESAHCSKKHLEKGIIPPRGFRLKTRWQPQLNVHHKTPPPYTRATAKIMRSIQEIPAPSEAPCGNA